MAWKSRAANGIAKVVCHFIRCARISIMGLPRRARRTASSASKYGCSRAKCWRITRNPQRRRNRRRKRRNARAGREQERRMLQPARRKYRKEQKGRNKGVATVGNKVSFGEYGLKAVGRGRLTSRQIEAARRAMTRHIKRGGRIWIRIFPDKPVSRKPAEVRMGNGKGTPEYYVAEIQPGKVLYEMDGVEENTAREAFALAAAKLPIRTTFVQRSIG